MSYSLFLNDELLNLFKKSGWYFGRSVDTSGYSFLGIDFNSIASAILREFGGIGFSIPRSGANIFFEPHNCNYGFCPELEINLENFLGKRISPFGGDDWGTFFCSELGNFFYIDSYNTSLSLFRDFSDLMNTYVEKKDCYIINIDNELAISPSCEWKFFDSQSNVESKIKSDFLT